MANAIVEATGGKIVDYVKVEDKDLDENIMEKAVESIKKREDRKRPEFTSNNRFNGNRNDKPRYSNDRPRYNNDRPNNFRTETPVVEVKEVVAPVEVKEVVAEVKPAQQDITKLTVAELRDLAKTKDVKGFSTMKKAELLEVLK